MARDVILVLPEGERSLAADKLPVLLGSGAGAHIRLPGPAGAPPAASINLLDDRALVQCYPGISGLLLNGDPISGAQWLEEGDRLAIAGVEITLDSLSPEAMRLGVSYLAQAWDTRPPELADDEDAPAAIAVRRPAGETRALPAQKGRLWLRLAAGVLLALLGGKRRLRVYRRRGIDRSGARGVPVEVDALLPTPHVGGRYLLWKGKYRVRAERERYYPLDEEIEVRGGGGEEFRFAMRLLPGRVVVETVAGAEIRIEGMDEVYSPGEEISLDPGAYALTVSAPRYKDMNVPLAVEGGGGLEPFSAELEPDWAEITASSDPPGAELRSEGQVLGTTPATVELLSGERVLSFSRPGFATHRRAADRGSGFAAGPARPSAFSLPPACFGCRPIRPAPALPWTGTFAEGRPRLWR